MKHMFGDSVESRVWISKEDRRKYYNEHPADFTTFPDRHVRGAARHVARGVGFAREAAAPGA